MDPKAIAKAIVPSLRNVEKEIIRGHLGLCPRSPSAEGVPVDVKMHKLAISGVLRANATKAKVAPIGMVQYAHSGNATCAREAKIAHLLMPRSCTAKPRLRRSNKLMLSKLREHRKVLSHRVIAYLLYRSQRRNLELRGTDLKVRLSYVER